MSPYDSEDPGILANIDAEIDIQYLIGDSDEESAAFQEHIATGRPLAVIAHNRGLNLKDPRFWGEPVDLNEDDHGERVNLIGSYENPLIDMALAVAKAVQFPRSTALLHGLGVFSSLLIRSFSYQMFDELKHPGLYVVCAQPPSSGKSPVNNAFVAPCEDVYHEINERNKPFLMTAKMKLQKLENEFAKGKGGANEMRAMAEEIQAAKEDVALYEPYNFAVTDTTPEALEECAARQHGRFSIIHDELEALGVVLGLNYTDGKSANLGVILNGWSGGRQNSQRIGRPGYQGRLFGAVAVLAQESTIKTILNVGRENGGSRGVCERFLIISEPNIIGEKDPDKYVAIPPHIKSNYDHLVRAVIATGNTILTFSPSAKMLVDNLTRQMIRDMADGGRFASELMRGVVGKADTQICKLAVSLHVAKEWSPGGLRSGVVQEPEMAHAIFMYMQLIKCFYSSAESQGIDGEKPELNAAIRRLKGILTDQRTPKQAIKYTQLCDGLKNTKPFSDIRGLRKHMKTKTLPALERNNYVVFDENDGVVFINPRLRD